jgi:hypothetical protein
MGIKNDKLNNKFSNTKAQFTFYYSFKNQEKRHIPDIGD